MSYPAMASQTFMKHQKDSKLMRITKDAIKKLKKIRDAKRRARAAHQMVDEKMDAVLSDPVVQKHLSCKKGCAFCCHTQVSVTMDEAHLLAHKIVQGHEIDLYRLENQAKYAHQASEWFKLSHSQRKCVFLGEDNSCIIYEDRPSVCRTNSAISEPQYCSTENGEQQQMLLKTTEADMIIMGQFIQSQENGALPVLLKKAIAELSCSSDNETNLSPLLMKNGTTEN